MVTTAPRTKAGSTHDKTGTELSPVDCIEAAERLAQDIATRLNALPDGVQIDDLLEVFRDLVGERGMPVVVAARMVADTYNTNVKRSVVTNRGTSGAALGQLTLVVSTAYGVFGEFSQSDDLADAEAAVIDAQRERSEALAELESAVTRADVDAVLKLRTDVEVTFPQKVETAQLRLQDLQIAHTETLADLPKQRLAHTESVVAKATDDFEVAQQALKDAEAALTNAHGRRARATALVADFETAIADLRSRRDATAMQAQRDTDSRFRRLAGLGEAPAQETSTPSDPARENTVMLRPQVQHTGLQVVEVEPSPMERIGNRTPSFSGWAVEQEGA